MIKLKISPGSYIDRPCERCGSKKKEIEIRNEMVETISGNSPIVVSLIICTNTKCQKIFDLNRAEEVLKSNKRKQMKVEQDKLRKEHMAVIIAERRMERMNQNLKKQ